jgi:D-alanyl-D-alanine carboxypeptidase
VVLGGHTAAARDSRMRDLIQETIARAADRRTVPLIAENAGSNDTASKPHAFAVASPAESVPTATPTRRNSTLTSTVSVAATPGSSDPIKPVLVKTISVKAGANQTLSMNSAGSEIADTSTTKSTKHEKPDIAAAPTDAPTTPTPIVNPQPSQLALALPPQAIAQPVVPKPAPASDTQIQTRPPASQNAAPMPTPAHEPDLAPSDGVTEILAKVESAPPPTVHSGWMIQVGALDALDEAQARLDLAQSKAKGLLNHADRFTETGVKGDKTLYRARFAGLDKEQAEAACKSLKRADIPCMALKN